MITATAVVAEVVRSGFVEGLHHGVACWTVDHRLARAVGAADDAILPRSSNKPAQAVAMLTAGLSQVLAPLEADERVRLTALATASHSGEPFHLQLVDRLLAVVGLTADDLACPVMPPLDRAEADLLLAAGGAASRRTMNCSGKHAAMLATCVAAGWPTRGYLAPEHPLQQHLQTTVGELAGETVTEVAVDGCGAPLFAITTTGLARTFGRLAASRAGTVERSVADAVVAHPDIVSGTRRPLVPLLAALPGAVGKDGAEGVFGLGLPDGRGFAVKIADGAERAAVPVLVAALRAAGVDAPGLQSLATTALHGGGEVVGEVRAVTGLLRG